MLERNTDIFSWSFISSIDQQDSTIFTLLVTLKAILHAWFFLLETNKLHTIFEWFELGVHLLIIVINIWNQSKHSDNSESLPHIKITLHLFFFIILLMIVHDNHLSNPIASLKAEVMIIVLFFTYFTLTKLFMIKIVRERNKRNNNVNKAFYRFNLANLPQYSNSIFIAYLILNILCFNMSFINCAINNKLEHHNLVSFSNIFIEQRKICFYKTFKFIYLLIWASHKYNLKYNS